ncbi:hydroxymethylglutaryl-CoA lyase [Carbonactinospora thermoautotrophica]|uniref:Hydroxymethylglutaryl-CoA lyase n=1 Tax=Carbonactinospora thermoautotrophica TaxID=1469144 RepID=A0A132NIG8_9ACTN|nr:hydroxymethylglutaryl-CoA lyase [Carbonactinospora thermoautotrophica]KWX05497.1 hydroxymethylglutaryl-CoA lyase [Carbonactinospora thermoautotrophica]KWX09961.1 hydroxymethylglutaryl-CoA lyase [Carbonactinospora thermoautotrophica]MCX9192404.1 hydroxymethylglutaryl-CoA lyase [Carbonactinospora thermoautotrophica]
MSDLPGRVKINEEGPREGFQIEKGPISTERKVEFIEALAETGVRKIDCVSFVNPKRVPQMADAEEVLARIRRKPGVRYTGLWLNLKGLERALASTADVIGAIRVTASDTFARANTGMGREETIEEQRRWLARYREAGVPVEWGYVMTAFGCNYEGDIPVELTVRMVARILELAAEFDVRLSSVYLADTVGHATPRDIQRVVGAVRERWPDLTLGLHLHDTRGLAVANAYAALQLGVAEFDTACAGLGGCPFAAHSGAAGNLCTEEFVFLCEEMGIETGIDLDRLIECAWLAEDIVGHQLPSKMTRGGSLTALRRRLAGTAS